MSNSKRQTVVIAVLILLIACAGWFAREFNNRQNLNALSTDAGLNQESANYFVESRMGRDNARSALQQEYEKIINDVNQTEESKQTASTQMMLLFDRGDNENKIETLVKERGYEDALCMINESGVELCVKSPEELNAEQVNAITDVIVRTTGIAPSNIVIKPQK
jgi:stage III sporulation protein AH